MLNISAEDFLTAIGSGDVPDMQSAVYTNVVRFFMKYPQDEIYNISGNIKDILAAFDGCAEIYSRFGIKYDNSAYKGHTLVSLDKEYILFIDSVAEISNKLSEHMRKYEKTPSYAAIITDDAEQAVSIAEQLSDLIPNCCVMNKLVMQQFDTCNTVRDTKNYKYIDITEQIRTAWKDTVDPNININGLVGLIDIIKSIPHDGRTIFYIADGADDVIQDIFVRLAVILTYDGINFEIRSSFKNLFLRLLLGTLEQNNMLLSDYLYKLAHPVTFGFYQKGEFGYVCLLDHRPGEVYDVLDLDLKILEAPLDSERLCLRSRQVETVNCSYEQLEIFDPIQLFGLEDMQVNPDDLFGKSVAVNNSIRLNALLTEFEEIISMHIKLKNDMTLNFTNVLFYQRDGQMYLGYMPKMPDVTYNYVLIPLCQRYKNFKQKFNRADYDRLMDMNVLVEQEALYKSLGQYTYSTMRHFTKPRFLNGLLLGCFPATKNILLPSCGLTLPEVGLWSVQAQSGRTTALSFLLQRFNRIELHNRRFLSFWGGCNPMDLTTLNVNYKIWGSDLNEQ